MSEIRLLFAGLFAGALVGMGLRVALVGVVREQLGMTEVVYALLLGIVGIGAVFGPPLPVPRLLGRVPLVALISISLVTLGVAASVVAFAGSLWIVAAVLFVCGVLAVSVDLIATTAARYAVPGKEVAEAMRGLAGAVIAGQLLSLVLVAVLSGIWGVAGVLSFVGAIAIAIGAILLLLSRAVPGSAAA